MSPQAIHREYKLPVRILAGCPFCEYAFILTRNKFPQHTREITGIGAIGCDGSELTLAEARYIQRTRRQERNPTGKPITSERQALLELFEIDSVLEGPITISIPEYNDLIESRATALKILLESDDSLLKEVATAATNTKRKWRKNKALRMRLAAWLYPSILPKTKGKHS